MNALDGVCLNCSAIDVEVVLAVGNISQESIKLKGTKGRYSVKLACSKKRGSIHALASDLLSSRNFAVESVCHRSTEFSRRP